MAAAPMPGPERQDTPLDSCRLVVGLLAEPRGTKQVFRPFPLGIACLSPCCPWSGSRDHL